MARHSPRRRPISDINVVPYIDVMLVLLVIFMITAPLLSQGVKVNLPQASAKPVEAGQSEPLIVTVDAAARYYLNYGEEPEKPLEPARLLARVNAVLRHRPGVPVLVKGDRAAAYGDVVVAMTLLQRAGVGSVGLLTEEPQSLKLQR